MRKFLLLGLLAGTLSFLTNAKDNLAIPSIPTSLHFIENNGQVVDQNHQPRTDIQFSIPGKGISVFIGDGQLHYQFYKATNPGYSSKHISIKDLEKKNTPAEYTMYRMDVELIGANMDAPVVKEHQQDFTASYYAIEATERGIDQSAKAKGAKDGIVAHAYDKITYKNVYPNIDWVLYIKNNQVEYEFEVRPGGNPADIKLKYNGATGLKVHVDGSMIATTPMGTINEAAPYSYQQDGSTVTSSFNLDGDVLSFNVGSYTGTLTIDPVLNWGTYYGGTGYEEYNSVAYDGTGSLYATGETNSPGNIATVGAHQTVWGGQNDIFISKFTTSGALLWTTYLGGAGQEFGVNITYDAFSASVYIAGYSTAAGDEDIYICQFSSTGTFIWDFLYGNTGLDVGTCVRCDALGNQYLCGFSGSTIGMTTTGVIQTANSGGLDGIITAFSPAGTVLWSTYYGGPSTDVLQFVGLDANGNIYAAGGTSSTQNISTLNTFGGWTDAFSIKINNTATLLHWGAYHGGTGHDEALAADIDPSGNLYMTGYTESYTGIASTGAFQPAFAGGTDAFISKQNSLGSLQWGSYYGGVNYDEGYAIHINGNSIFIGGYASSFDLNTTGGFQTTIAGPPDAFLAKISSTGTFSWGTFYGGTLGEEMNSITSDNGLSIYCAGITGSQFGIAYNTTVQSTLGGGADAFLARIEDCNMPGPIGAITGPASICAGSTQTYSVAPVTGATTYTWTLPSGWTGLSTSNTISITAGTTSGTISVTANNSCGSTPPQTMNVTILPSPMANITAGGPTSFCQGGSVVLTTNTGTGYSYQWYNGTTPVGTNSNTYTATASGSYTVVVTAGSCNTTSAAVTVTNTPIPAIPTATSNTPICAGSTLNLTANSSTTGVTYNWTGPNNFPNTQNPTIPGASVSDAGVYSVTATLNGCTSAVATINVVITPGPPTQPGTITGPTSVCAGSNQSYMIAPVTGATGYTWTYPTGWTPGTTTTTTGTATAGTTGGNVTVTANNACGSGPAQTLAVTVIPAPTATITPAGPTTFCQGGNVVLNANTGTGLTYQWYNGTTPIPGATNSSYTANASGSYTVVASDGTCGTTSAVVNVTVNPLPTPTITQSGNTLSTTNTYTTYQWYDGSGAIPGATNQSYTATQNGDYYVVVTDANGCTAQSNTIQLTLSVGNLNGTGTVSLYPNPNNGNFFVNGTFSANDGKMNIQVIDVAGRIVHSEQGTVKNNTITTQINMKVSLAPGIYTLKLASDIANTAIPFVKQ